MKKDEVRMLEKVNRHDENDAGRKRNKNGNLVRAGGTKMMIKKK